MSNKILIVGGGPAGSSAAIQLLKNKHKVTLFERGNKDRSKTCGEGLTPESQYILSKLGLLKKVRKIAFKTNELTLFDLSNKPISINNTYYTVKRTIFDKLLRDEVTRLNGKVVYNTTITSIKVLSNKAIIEDQNKRQYEGGIVILATGAETQLSKSLGFTSNSYTAVSMRAYAQNTIACKTLEFYFHKKLFPAYGWIFPLPGNILNIGVYTHKDSGPIRDLSKLMNLFYEVLVERYGKPLKLIGQPKGWVLNTGLITKNICSDRVLLCGENIASAYNFSGEGIGPSMKSGLLAADTIVESNGDYSKEKLLTYEQKIQKELGPMHNGYNKIMKLSKYKILYFIFTILLRSSKRVKRLIEKIIDEEISFNNIFSLKSLKVFFENKF